jgi:hypothetical protein
MKAIGKNTQGNEQFTFEGKLLSIGSTILQNSNLKNYKLVNLEFADVNGVVQQASAAIYEGNYSKGVEVGKSYLTTATIVGDKAYLQMSHLIAGAGFASVSMFLAEASVQAVAKVGSLTT